MLEESIDPRPSHEAFARFLARRAGERAEPATIEAWLSAWSDDDGVWTNLSNIEHWIERSRR